MANIQPINDGEEGLSVRTKLNETITEANKVEDKVDKVVGKALSDENYTIQEKNKLLSIQPRAEVNVQSDFEELNPSQDGFILNKPIKAETNLTLSGAVSVDIRLKQSYIFNLTGNVDLTIDATDIATDQSFVAEFRITTSTGVETLSLLNTTDTKDIYGTFDPAVVNKLVISATRDASGNAYLTYIFNQPN